MASSTGMSLVVTLPRFEAGRAAFEIVLVLLMVLNSRQKLLVPKKKEEGIAPLFSFLNRPALAGPSSLLSPVPAPAEAAAAAAAEVAADRCRSPGSPSRPGRSASPE